MFFIAQQNHSSSAVEASQAKILFDETHESIASSSETLDYDDDCDGKQETSTSKSARSQATIPKKQHSITEESTMMTIPRELDCLPKDLETFLGEILPF